MLNERVYQSIVESIRLYNTEILEINKKHLRRLKALQLDAIPVKYIPNTTITDKMKIREDSR